MAPFSIREYALDMREVGKDLRRSWPFSEKVKKEVAESLLPPIDVKKFRWWSHELESLKSKNNSTTRSSSSSSSVAEIEEMKMEKICPVCGVFVTATVNAMNAHIDSCLAQIRRKSRGRKSNCNKGGGGGGGGGKSRTGGPKKRSIAEIFAVAPPVETTMIIINHCDAKQKQLKATSLARSLVSAIKTINKNKNNKDFGHDQQLCKKGKRKREDVSIRCKKPCFKRLSRQKKKKLVKKSNIVVAKQQRPVPPIRSILKHSVKVVSETNPSSSNLKGSNHVINNGGQKSDRRVSFLDKDDVLGPSTRAFSDTFEQNVANSFEASEGSTNSGESNKGVDSMEIGINEDVVNFISTQHDVDSQQVKGKIQLPNIHDQVINAQSTMRAHPCRDNTKQSSVSANRDIPHENNLHLFNHVYVDVPQKLPPVHCSANHALLAAQEERQYGHIRTQCGSSFPRAHTFYEKSVDHLINPVNGVAALGSITNTVPSFALSDNSVGRFLNLAESSTNDTRCSIPNWEQSAVAYKEKGANDEFFCLPLNSKGELIQLNSCLVNRFDQMNEASDNVAYSSRIPVCGLVLPRGNRDYFVDNEKLFVDKELTGNQLSLFPLHSTMQENQNRYLSARFDVDEPGTSEAADIRLLNSERGTESGRFYHSNLMDPPFNRCRYYGTLQNQNVSREIYPENSSGTFANPARQTMRLMGKDVAVGGNGKEVQEPEVINFWKNSTLIDNCLTNPIQENPMRKRNFLQDRMFYPAGYHGNQVAQSNLFPNAPQVRYPHPRLNRKGGIMYQRSSDSVINLNERFNNIHAFSPSSMTDQTYNTAPNFQQAPFISGPQTLRFGNPQPPAFHTSPHIFPNRFENSFELGYNQSLHPAKLGTFNFPYLQPDDENHVHLPWFHSPNSCLPPWMLHGHQREEAPTAYSKLADVNGYYYPFVSSGTDFLISPSSMHTMPSHLQMKNIPGSTSFFQPIPVAPRVQSPSIQMSSELDRLRFTTLSKKRLGAELVDSRKHQKMSSLEMNNSDVVPGWTRGKFTDDVRYHPGTTTEIHANWDRAVNSVGNIPNVTQNDGLVISTTNNEAPKAECMARSGPIKLTAGAKHILKPSQSMDVDNTKPTYSTIPSAGLVHSVNLAGSQKKSTKVYSF